MSVCTILPCSCRIFISRSCHFLSSFSLSIEQLQHFLEQGHYMFVLQRCQEYIHCLSYDETTVQLRVYLLATAWESVCRYKTIHYKIAHHRHYRLRYELKAPKTNIQSALEKQNKLAEQVVACQKQHYLIKQWKRRVDQCLERQHQGGTPPEQRQDDHER